MNERKRERKKESKKKRKKEKKEEREKERKKERKKETNKEKINEEKRREQIVNRQTYSSPASLSSPRSPTSSSPPLPLAIEGDGAVSGARFWGVTLKKTPGKAKDAEPRDGDAAGAVGEDAATAAAGAPGEQDAGGAGSVEGDKEGQDA